MLTYSEVMDKVSGVYKIIYIFIWIVSTISIFLTSTNIYPNISTWLFLILVAGLLYYHNQKNL